MFDVCGETERKRQEGKVGGGERERETTTDDVASVCAHLCLRVSLCACVCVRACACGCACKRVRMRMCVRVMREFDSKL